MYDFQYLGSTVTLWQIRSSRNLLRVIEKYIILWTVNFNYKLLFPNVCNWIFAFIIKPKIRRHIRIHRRNSKNPSNRHKNSPFSKRYITSNEIVLKKYRWRFKHQFLFLSSISTGHMPDRTSKIWDLSFHSGNNDILFASTGTRACRLGLLWSWMVCETFDCLV